MGPPLTGQHGFVFSVAFSPDGKMLISAGCERFGATSMLDCKQGEIRFWNVDTREALGEPLRAHDHYVAKVAFSPDGKILASSSLDQTLILSAR